MSNRTNQSAKGTVGGVPILVLVLAAVGIVVAIGVGIALSGGDDDDVATADGETATEAFGPIAVEGDPLPRLESESDDAAVGMDAPVLTGFDLAGDAVIAGGDGRPTMLAFLAHWCPHCQRELPQIVAAAEDGLFGDVRVVGVLTGTDPAAPNFPPGAWLADEGFTGDVLLDDEDQTAAAAFGLSGYPFVVWIDADGTVVGRTSGERGPSNWAGFVELLGSPA